MRHIKKIVCSVSAAITLIVTDVVPNNVIVSPAGLEQIGNAEECRLNPYVCPAGRITNGIGNIHGVSNKTITIKQVAKDWARNIESAQNCLTSSADVSLMSQGQIDAFTSFIFNTGCTRFKRNSDGSETRIYNYIHHGDYHKACNELKFWVYGAGKKLPGLVKRRQKETELCFAK